MFSRIEKSLDIVHKAAKNQATGFDFEGIPQTLPSSPQRGKAKEGKSQPILSE